MDVFWFWILLFLFVVAILAWPAWPYTRGRGLYGRPGRWRYAPSAAALIVALLLLLLIWFGLLAVWLPWPLYPVD